MATMDFEQQDTGAGFRSLLSSGSALSTWDTITFKTESAYNLKAPEPWVTFLTGGVSSSRKCH
jgi:hypothetical protein